MERKVSHATSGFGNMKNDWKKHYLVKKARDLLGGNEKGAVAIVAALALPVLILAAGGAADYTRILAARSKLQAAVDSATLAAYMHYYRHDNLSMSQLEKYFGKHLKASLQSNLERKVRIRSRKLHLNRKKNSLRAIVKGDINTTFIRFAGIPKMTIAVKSVARAAMSRTEVALVLDTTGSMKGPKIAELKRAAVKFLDTLEAKLPGKRDMFKVGIVPFAQYVKVGKKYRNASWIHVEPDAFWAKSTVMEEHCSDSSTCLRWEWGPHKECKWVGDGDGAGGESCKTVFGKYCAEWKKKSGSCVKTPTEKKKWIAWEGCVGSRDYPFNLTDGDYGTHKVPAVMTHARVISFPRTDYNGWANWNNCNVAPITPLTSLKKNKKALIGSLDLLEANGPTYIPAGLMWGWRLLSPQEPFKGSSDPNVRKVIILMTDGRNTRSPDRRSDRLYRDHVPDDTDATDYANQLLTKLCSNIKAIDPATGRPHADIITITFNVKDATIKNLLQHCSTLGAYDVKSGQLEKLFENIANNLVELHLAE